MPSEECDHPVSKVDSVDPRDIDPSGAVRAWGFCECGAPTIVTLMINDVRYDDGDDNGE